MILVQHPRRVLNLDDTRGLVFFLALAFLCSRQTDSLVYTKVGACSSTEPGRAVPAHDPRPGHAVLEVPPLGAAWQGRSDRSEQVGVHVLAIR